MLIKNSKVLIINGNWLHPSGESPVPPGPGPEPSDGWKNITGSTLNSASRNYETYATDWAEPRRDMQGWRGQLYSSQTSVNITQCGNSTMYLTGETVYKDYLLLDITSMYYLECSNANDYYYPSYGRLSILDIDINYQTTSSTDLSPISKTQSNETLITISETNGNSFQVKIGDTLGNAGSCSNIKLLFDLNNHITYALCRPVPLTTNYDPTDFTNLKWHVLKSNNGYDRTLLTRSSIDYVERIGKYNRTDSAGSSHWIVSGLIMDRNIPQWSYKGTLNLQIDNESYHDYTNGSSSGGSGGNNPGYGGELD